MQIVYSQLVAEMRQGNYRKIGQGSGRIVYDMGNGYVIKYAKNPKGIAQNRQENEIYHMYYDRIFAAILAVSEDYRMLIMEKAVPYQTGYALCRYYDVHSLKELLQVPQIRRLIDVYHLIGADLIKISSWGDLQGVPVLIDYGFTVNVKRKYYNRFV